MRPALAALPILGLLVAMAGFGWSAVRAGTVAAVGSVALGIVVFGLGDQRSSYGRLDAIGGVLAEAAFVTVTVVAIVAPALALHHLQQRTGATPALHGALGRLAPDPRAAALLIAWFFSLFLEGAAGFGTPVALAAPFLVATGFSPVAAVSAALLGHAAGVSFGALGTPVVAQVAASDFAGRELARATVDYHAAVSWVLMAAVMLVVARELPSGRSPWLLGPMAAGTFFLPYWMIGRFIGPELPTLAGAIIGGLAFVLAIRIRSQRQPKAAQRGERGALVRAAAPYLALVAVVLVTRLVPPVREALSGVTFDWELLGDFSGSVRPLFHPGVLLPVAFGVAVLAQRASAGDVRSVVATTNAQLVPVSLALLAMVTIARTMSHAGMIDELAGAAAGVGAAWPLLAPAVGALGTFVTGSATASNILFTEFQETTAAAAGLAPLPLLGAQGFGAAIGNVICPHNIVAAAATVQLTGEEGQVLRRTLPVAALAVTLGGGLALVLAG